jgi:hypothetical protein
VEWSTHLLIVNDNGPEGSFGYELAFCARHHGVYTRMHAPGRLWHALENHNQ